MLRPGGRGGSNPQTPRDHPATARSPYTGSRYVSDSLRATPNTSTAYRRPVQTVDVNNVTQSLLSLQENARTHAAELEMERNNREIAIKELSTRTKNEFAELRDMIKQLRTENSNLRETVWTLERNMRLAPVSTLPLHEDPRLSYFGNGERAVVHHDEMPLIPRVHDLETALDKLKRGQERLLDQERLSVERLDQVQSDLATVCSQAVDEAKQFTERQVTQLKDLLELEKDARLRDHDEIRNDLMDATTQLRHEMGVQGDGFNRRFNDVDDAVAKCVAANGSVGPALAKLEATVDASETATKQRLEEATFQLKQDVEKQLRQARDERVDAQQDLQRHVSQKVEVVTASFLQREEFTRFQKQIVADLQSEVAGASKHAQQARVTAEDTRRELAAKLADLDLGASELTTKVEQVSQAIKAQEQVGRNNNSDIGDVKGQIRIMQTAADGLDHQLTKVSAKVAALEETSDATINSLGRLKAQVESQHHNDASEREQQASRLAMIEATSLEARKDLRNTDSEVATIRLLAERALALTDECHGTLSSERGLGGEASKRAQSSIETLQKALNDLRATHNSRVTEVDNRIDEIEKRVVAVEGGEKKLVKRVDDLATAIGANEQETGSKLASIASVQIATEKAVADVVAQARKAATQEQLSAVEEALVAKAAELHSKTDKNRKELLAKIEILQECDSDLAAKITKTETAIHGAAERISTVAGGQQKLEIAQEELRETTAAIVNRGASSRKDPLADSRFEELEQRIEAISNTGKSNADVLKRRVEEVNGDLGDLITDLQQKHTTVARDIRAISDEIGPIKDDNVNIQSLLNDAADGIQALSVRVDEVSSDTRELRDVINSRDANMDAIEAAMHAIDEDMRCCVDAVVPYAGTPFDHLADALKFLASHSVENRSDSQAQAETIVRIASIVDRHEVGFASMGEILEALKFHTENITCIADRVGLEKERFQLKVFEESDLRSVIDDAARRSS